MSQVATLPEVLTLKEASEFLRLSPATIKRQAIQGNIPGQFVEGSWRFLHTALVDWLRHQDSRAVLLRQAGALANDKCLPELLESIYQARGRSEIDADSNA